MYWATHWKNTPTRNRKKVAFPCSNSNDACILCCVAMQWNLNRCEPLQTEYNVKYYYQLMYGISICSDSQPYNLLSIHLLLNRFIANILDLFLSVCRLINKTTAFRQSIITQHGVCVDEFTEYLGKTQWKLIGMSLRWRFSLSPRPLSLSRPTASDSGYFQFFAIDRSRLGMIVIWAW